jgi:ABC-type antimicrobial peptide transport system permease subunit
VLAWDRATGLSAEERREVGVLKTVGWSTRDVIAARMTEAVLVATIAAFAGGLGAYVYVFVFRAPGMLDALLGWSSLYPTFTLAPGTDATSLATIVACTVAPYIAAAAIPAWRAATLDPAEAMR